MTLASRLYDQLAPYAHDDATNNFALLKFLTALAAMSDEVDEYASDGANGEAGWSSILDINRAPTKALPWLAQFIGVTINPALSDADQRSQILKSGGWQRGSLAAIKSAPAPYLSGTKTVILRERDAAACPSLPAYGLTVITYINETDLLDQPVTNLVSNPDFPVDNSQWSTAAGSGAVPTIAWAASDPTIPGVTGPFALCTFPNVDVVPVNKYVFDTNQHAVVAGEKIYIRMNAYGDGGSWLVIIDQAGGAHNMVSNPSEFTETHTGSLTVPDATNNFLLDGTFTVPAGVTSIRLGIMYAVPASTTRFVRIDNVMATRAPAGSPYTGVTPRPAGLGPIGDALRAAKPAGIILNYVVLAGEDYTSLLANHPLYSNIFADFLTYQGVATATPGT